MPQAESEENGLNKYNSDTCLPSTKKMLESFPEMVLDEKINGNKIDKYLFDFSIIKDYLSDKAYIQLIDKACNDIHSLVFREDFLIPIIDDDNKTKNYISLYFDAMRVCSDKTGKTRYIIMKLEAFTISGHKINYYGHVEEMESSRIKFGTWYNSDIEYLEI